MSFYCQIDDRSVFVHRFYYDGDGPDDEDGNPGGLAFLAVPSGVHNYSHGVPMDIWDGGVPLSKHILTMPLNLSFKMSK